MTTGGTGRRAKSRMCPYLQHTEGVHQSIMIIINHYFPPPKNAKTV